MEDADIYLHATCLENNFIQLTVSEDQQCLETIYEAQIANGECASIDSACICFDWTLSCVSEIHNTKAITNEVDTSVGDIEIYINLYQNQFECAGFMITFVENVNFNEVRFFLISPIGIHQKGTC